VRYQLGFADESRNPTAGIGDDQEGKASFHEERNHVTYRQVVVDRESSMAEGVPNRRRIQRASGRLRAPNPALRPTSITSDLEAARTVAARIE
jgi:hypothetical protein